VRSRPKSLNSHLCLRNHVSSNSSCRRLKSGRFVLWWTPLGLLIDPTVEVKMLFVQMLLGLSVDPFAPFKSRSIGAPRAASQRAERWRSSTTAALSTTRVAHTTAQGMDVTMGLLIALLFSPTRVASIRRPSSGAKTCRSASRPSQSDGLEVRKKKTSSSRGTPELIQHLIAVIFTRFCTFLCLLNWVKNLLYNRVDFVRVGLVMP